MRRREPVEVESAGHESFLDVVTNIVCILIILVMIVGQHANQLVEAEASAPPPEAKAAADAHSSVASLEQDLNGLTTQIMNVQQTAAARFVERDRLSTILAAAEHDLAEHRAKVDEKSRHRYDLERDKALAMAELDRLERERKQLASGGEASVKIENFPTPIAKVVDDKEIHFQLRHGRIAYIPFGEFADKFHSLAYAKKYKLQDSNEFTESYGPIYDFTVRYTIARVDATWEEAVHSGQGGSYAQLSHFHFYPVSHDIGEPVAQAMNKTSAFRGKLEECNPRRYTITFWIYPDSFDEFNRIRKQLYELGYAVGGRPTPEGKLPGGSSQGSKTSSQ